MKTVKVIAMSVFVVFVLASVSYAKDPCDWSKDRHGRTIVMVAAND